MTTIPMIVEPETPIGVVAELKDRYTLDLFAEPAAETERLHQLNRANLGTFADSLRAPVHRWFTYPAGFSHRAVEEAFRTYDIKPGHIVYDPFAGTGTTNVVARQRGVRSFGVEAHPFVQFVAQTKLFWEYDYPALARAIDDLIGDVRTRVEGQDLSAVPITTLFPELVCKCYSPRKLATLSFCRDAVFALPDSPFCNFAKLALTHILRSVADVATGWPYIAPQKAKNAAPAKQDKDVVTAFHAQMQAMYGDLQSVRRGGGPYGEATLIAGDSRETHPEIADASADLAFTSPPYLNNYDYADRTRLETYFWGEAKTWGDITEKVRSKLMMSATTQINRGDYDPKQFLSAELCDAVPHITALLTPKIAELSRLRLIKGGKKSYDIMVAGYFNDMLRILRETRRVLKPGASFLLILGDSAPYGVYIPIDIYLGEIGLSVGFTGYSVEDLRVRGGKWKDNPQRHSVVLKECILTLTA